MTARLIGLKLNNTAEGRGGGFSYHFFPWLKQHQGKGRTLPWGCPCSSTKQVLPTGWFVPDDGNVSSRAAEPCDGPKICRGLFFKTFYLF